MGKELETGGLLIRGEGPGGEGKVWAQHGGDRRAAVQVGAGWRGAGTGVWEVGELWWEWGLGVGGKWGGGGSACKAGGLLFRWRKGVGGRRCMGVNV